MIDIRKELKKKNKGRPLRHCNVGIAIKIIKNSMFCHNYLPQ